MTAMSYTPTMTEEQRDQLAALLRLTTRAAAPDYVPERDVVQLAADIAAGVGALTDDELVILWDATATLQHYTRTAAVARTLTRLQWQPEAAPRRASPPQRPDRTAPRRSAGRPADPAPIADRRAARPAHVDLRHDRRRRGTRVRGRPRRGHDDRRARHPHRRPDRRPAQRAVVDVRGAARAVRSADGRPPDEVVRRRRHRDEGGQLMALTKFRLLTTAGQIEAQRDLGRNELHEVVSLWMSMSTLDLLDSRGAPLIVRSAAVVAVVEGWG